MKNGIMIRDDGEKELIYNPQGIKANDMVILDKNTESERIVHVNRLTKGKYLVVVSNSSTDSEEYSVSIHRLAKNEPTIFIL